MLFRRNLLLPVLLLVLTTPGHSTTVKAVGEFVFSSSMSEDRACLAAEQRAKEEAVRSVRGETISADEQFSCKERSGIVDNEQCVLNRFTWNRLDGQLKRSKVTNRFVVSIVDAPSFRKCRIEIEVDVVAKSNGNDPSFDYRVEPNQTIFKPGEKLSLKISSGSKFYLSVFNWIPAEKNGAITRIFPNVFEPQSLVERSRIIPSVSPASYDFELTLPKNLEGDFSDEYLLFVGTKTPIKWLDQYAIDDLNERLMELDSKDKRIRRLAYRVVKPL